MRNLLALIGFVIVVFLAVGYARDWYSFDISTDSNGKLKIVGDIDRNKIREDGSKTLDKAGDAIDSLRKKPESGSDQPLMGPPAPGAGQ